MDPVASIVQRLTTFVAESVGAGDNSFGVPNNKNRRVPPFRHSARSNRRVPNSFDGWMGGAFFIFVVLDLSSSRPRKSIFMGHGERMERSASRIPESSTKS